MLNQWFKTPQNIQDRHRTRTPRLTNKMQPSIAIPHPGHQAAVLQDGSINGGTVMFLAPGHVGSQQE